MTQEEKTLEELSDYFKDAAESLKRENPLILDGEDCEPHYEVERPPAYPVPLCFSCKHFKPSMNWDAKEMWYEDWVCAVVNNDVFLSVRCTAYEPMEVSE